MKRVLYKTRKPNILIILFLILLFVILSSVLKYNLNSMSVFNNEIVVEVNKCEVKSRLLMDAMNKVGSCTVESTSKLWADGLKMRSAAMQYASMSYELRKEYAKQLERSSPNWITGISSPWISKYELLNIKKQMLIIL